MSRALRWVVVLVTTLTLAVAAHMFRYVPIVQPEAGIIVAVVWDRWRHRPCLIVLRAESDRRPSRICVAISDPEAPDAFQEYLERYGTPDADSLP